LILDFWTLAGVVGKREASRYFFIPLLFVGLFFKWDISVGGVVIAEAPKVGQIVAEIDEIETRDPVSIYLLLEPKRRPPMTHHFPVPTEIRDALEQVLAYAMLDEADDFANSSPEERDGHIYQSLLAVRR